jgi:ubiquinone/menaquinone biosynthesis C-methylase UbiE
MAEQNIRFDDGEAYEQMMGIWSRSVGEVFLDWLAPLPGLRWIDVGCGNGAFTEVLVERCAPVEVQGIDPSEGSSLLPGHDPRRSWRNFAKATQWHFPFPLVGSTQPLWRWSLSSFPIRPKALRKWCG